jgi:hypothetical protein
MIIKKWEDLPKGVLFHTFRKAEGKGVLVDPVDWKEIEFDKDRSIPYGEATCEGITYKLYTVPKQVEDSNEYHLD